MSEGETNPSTTIQAMPTNHHFIITEEERLAIVNALAFYHYRHDPLSQLSLEDDRQYAMAYREDSASVDVDALATKAATL